MDDLIVDQAIDKLVEHLSEQQNVLKAVEECAELQEVLVKYLTKSPELRPKKEKIIEEAGDVIFRVMAIATLFNIEDEVEQRIVEKAKVLHDWAVNKFETFKN